MTSLLAIIIGPLILWTSSASAVPLQGSWQAIGYYYEGQFIQPPDAQLILTFDFFADGTHRLFWRIKTESKFCERKGLWRVDGDQLFIEVTWVNPENGPTCSQDPDMQMGLKTQSTVDVKASQLFIEMPFSDSIIIYVWDPLPGPIKYDDPGLLAATDS